MKPYSSIMLRWWVPVFLVATFLLLILVSAMWRDQQEAMHAQLREQEQLLHRMARVRNRIESYNSLQSSGAVDAEIAQFGADPDVDIVALVDENEKVVFSSYLPAIGQSVQVILPIFDIQRLEFSKQQRRLQIDADPDHRYLLAYQPITLKSLLGQIRPTKQGGLLVKFDLTSSRAIARRDSQIFSLVETIFALTVFALMILFFRRWLSQPLNYLHHAVGRISQGDLNTPIELIGRGELAELAASVDHMRLSLINANEERQQNEAALETSNQRFRELVDSTDGVVWEADAVTFSFTNISSNVERMLGYPASDWLVPGFWASHIHPEDRDQAIQYCASCTGRLEDHDFEYRFIAQDGQVIWLRDMVKVIVENGQPRWLRGLMIDISGIKAVQEALNSALGDKDALLKEVHHRVKNNLQVIVSLLRLESGRHDNAETQTVLGDMQGRIRSMAMLHESLYQTGTFAHVELGSYLNNLSQTAFHSQTLVKGAVQLHLEMASVYVEMDQALPCGLLLNELLSNSLKHGFPQGRTGDIFIRLRVLDEGKKVQLSVTDTGVGLPADFETRRENSLGMGLVSDLTEQLHGTLEIGPGPGASFVIVFAVNQPGDRKAA